MVKKHSDLKVYDTYICRARTIVIHPKKKNGSCSSFMNDMLGNMIYCNPYDTMRHHMKLGEWYDVIISVKDYQRDGPCEGRTVSTVLAHITTDIHTTPLSQKSLAFGDMTQPDLEASAKQAADNDNKLPSFITKPSPPKLERDWQSEVMDVLKTVRCLRTDDIVFKVTGCRKHYSDLTDGEKEQYQAVNTALGQLHKMGELARIACFRDGNQSKASHVYWGRNLDDAFQVLDPNYDNRKKHEKLAAYGNAAFIKG